MCKCPRCGSCDLIPNNYSTEPILSCFWCCFVAVYYPAAMDKEYQ
jgi:hypothetical protein